MDKIKKGDEVVIIAGRDKGKRGTVNSRVNETHLLVEGINLVKKHQKPNPMKGVTGGGDREIHADRPIEFDATEPRHRQR